MHLNSPPDNLDTVKIRFGPVALNNLMTKPCGVPRGDCLENFSLSPGLRKELNALAELSIWSYVFGNVKPASRPGACQRDG